MPMKSKCCNPKAVMDLLSFWQTERGTVVKCVRTDKRSEFLKQQIKEFCAQQGTKMESSAPYKPKQNGVAERMTRTLKEWTRTLLVHAAANPSQWGEALETATLLYNVGPTSGRS
jgi:transposase InsO family protein